MKILASVSYRATGSILERLSNVAAWSLVCGTWAFTAGVPAAFAFSTGYMLYDGAPLLLNLAALNAM